jgi:hypothetical protein
VSVPPYTIAYLRLERLDDVIAWPVFTQEAYERLLAAVDDGEFGPAMVVEAREQQQVA